MFLWAHGAPERLGKHLGLVEDDANELLLSVASVWEIAIKYAVGRMALRAPPEHYVPDLIRIIGARSVTIEQSHVLAAGALPPIHGDPFDRLLVAQAQLLDAELLTADATLARYPVRTLLVGR